MHTPLCASDAVAISYTLLRHLGLMLVELSAQGLQIWQDERQRWRWSWSATGLQAERGYWALGEAIVDAVATRYPAAFDRTTITGVDERTGGLPVSGMGMARKWPNEWRISRRERAAYDW